MKFFRPVMQPVENSDGHGLYISYAEHKIQIKDLQEQLAQEHEKIKQKDEAILIQERNIMEQRKLEAENIKYKARNEKLERVIIDEAIKAVESVEKTYSDFKVKSACEDIYVALNQLNEVDDEK